METNKNNGIINWYNTNNLWEKITIELAKTFDLKSQKIQNNTQKKVDKIFYKQNESEENEVNKVTEELAWIFWVNINRLIEKDKHKSLTFASVMQQLEERYS